MADTIDAPNEAALVAENDPALDASRDALFKSIHDKLNAEQPKQETTPDAVVEQPKKEAAKPEAKAESEFPDEILTGEKPEPKPVKDEITEIAEAAGKKPNHSHFEKLQNVAREAKQRAETLQKELETLRTAPAAKVDEGELKAALERAAELEALVERTNFQASPRFRALDEQQQSALNDAKAYLDEDADKSVIDRAASVTGTKRLEILRSAGLEPEVIAAITPLLAASDSVARQKSTALENAKQVRAEWEQQAKLQQQATEAKQRAEEERVYSQVTESVAKHFEPFQKVEGNDKWNAQVDQLHADAKQFFAGDMPLEKLAEVALYGVGAKVIHKMFHAQRAQIASLKKQLSELSSAQPAGGSDGSAPGAPKAPQTEAELAAWREAQFQAALGGRMG